MMSADTNQLGSIRYVTDHDCGNYRLGEVDGGFDMNELKRYLDWYGPDGYRELCEQMVHMSMQLTQAMAHVRMASSPGVKNESMKTINQ